MIEQRPHRRWLRSWARSAQVRVGAVLACGALLLLVLLLLSAGQWVRASGQSSIVNQVGAMRMQAWVVAAELADETGPPERRSEQVRQAIEGFDRRLNDPELRLLLAADRDAAKRRALHAIESDWQQRMRPLAADGLASVPAREAYRRHAPAFVSSINDAVDLVERKLERHVASALIYLGLAALVLIAGLIVFMFALKRQLFAPVAALVMATDRLRAGDFAARAAVARDDEFGRLGHAFNRMVEEIARLAGPLDHQVQEETFDLARSNRSLTLLYQATRTLSESPVGQRTLGEVLAATTRALAHPDVLSCALRVQPRAGGDLKVVVGVAEPIGGNSHTYPVSDGASTYGELTVFLRPAARLQAWQQELAATIARHIGAALTGASSREEHRRLAVLEERNAIARELHDSLAQTLAYIKIQIVRLAALLEHGAPGEREALRAVLAELREGATGAYRQLRELLTHFRIGGGGVVFAEGLRTAVDEFERRSGLRIEVRNELLGDEFAPAVQGHVLQIVREALSNVEKHAHAAAVKLHLIRDGQDDVPAAADALAVEIAVEDDGVGTRVTESPFGHFGLNIMRDRAAMIGGSLAIERRANRGTCVRLRVPIAAADGHAAADAVNTLSQHHG